MGQVTRISFEGFQANSYARDKALINGWDFSMRTMIPYKPGVATLEEFACVVSPWFTVRVKMIYF